MYSKDSKFMPLADVAIQTAKTNTSHLISSYQQFQPYVELLTWGSIDNTKLYRNGQIKAKYRHYVAEQIKMEPVGHTSLRFVLPADPQVIKRLESLTSKGVSCRETKVFVGVKNPDGTFSRQSIPALDIYFSWWPKKFQSATMEFDMYSELSNRLSHREKNSAGSHLVNYETLITQEHRKAIHNRELFEKIFI